MKTQIKKIRSGGQTGVDRGALDAARAVGIPIVGWCPNGGLAEDYTIPPGLLFAYPELEETPSKNVNQRTEWNVRDSDATLIILDQDDPHSPGTLLTEQVALALSKPLLISRTNEIEKISAWIKSLASNVILNIAGPRESESPGIYQKVYSLICELFEVGVAGNVYTEVQKNPEGIYEP